jgi:hypothetical protein
VIVSRLILLPRATSSTTQSRPSVMQYVFLCLDRVATVDRNQPQLHGAAKILDECLPPDDVAPVSPVHYINIVNLLTICILQGASQLDARGSTFNDVGRDLHYHINHINVNVYPHGSLSMTHRREEIAVCKFDSSYD